MAAGHPARRRHAQCLIAFNDEWVPDHTLEELHEKSRAVKALVAKMEAAGVFIFTGGLDDATVGRKGRGVLRLAARCISSAWDFQRLLDRVGGRIVRSDTSRI